MPTMTTTRSIHTARSFRLACRYFLCLIALLAGVVNAQEAPPLLETAQGKLLGTFSERAPAVRVFKGIPYA
ncbi:MAG: hypothetical protein WD600_14315, partial [Pseudohongiella sp.]